ncbi:MAG: hypothetical protein M1167_02545 [Chloroflexi bacterium]|nr:hypothetical protein [Chloroflexota bacterium]
MTPQLTSLTVTIELDQKDLAKPSFETAVTEAIDEVFTSLGENVKQATYRYLENKYGIRKAQIPNMIEGFTDAVESIFGDAAKLVELKIIERLQSKVRGFSYKPKNREMLFVEYLMELQRYL